MTKILVVASCNNTIRVILWFTDENPDAEDAFDDEDLMPPLSPTGERITEKKIVYNRNHKIIVLFHT